MKNNPNIINKVTVSYYRSINKQTIKNIKPLNIITGSNDVGKSNLLRALNLFFHEKDEHSSEFDFQKEFSQNRLATVQKDSVKGQQFIRIDVEFNCPDAFPGTLPDKFVVSKKWTKDSDKPAVTNNLQRQIDSGKLKTTINKAEGGLSRFMKQIEFHYIPAIKDITLFRSLLGELQQVLSQQAQKKGSSLGEDMEKFNSELQAQATELRSEFFNATGVETNIGLPIQGKRLFQAFEVRTKSESGAKIGLDQRGDGIRVRFIPEILNYISERSNKTHIWGFEEPENSMEYRKAFELAEKMSNVYSKNSQIFVTTHSPAFFEFDEGKKSIFLARQVEGDTHFRLLKKKEEEAIEEGSYDLMLADELGHVSLMHDLNEKLRRKIGQLKEQEITHSSIVEKIQNYEKPVLLTEGVTDKLILKQAWARLRKGQECPFKIEECDTTSETDISSGGAEKLSTCLKAIRSNQPNLVIGLFDYDDEGIKRYKLDNTFLQSNLFDYCKTSINKKAVAICLQGCPEYHKEFRTYENLSMEFMFPSETLNKQLNGKGLTLKPKTLVTRIGNKEVNKQDASEIWHMDVVSNKKYFAEKIVPILDDDEFIHFENLFSRIETAIASV